MRPAGIRNFIVETIIQQSGDEALMRTEKAYLGKLDMTLIQVSYSRRDGVVAVMS